MKQNKFGRILYGGDYNPEQWLDQPEILEQDIALMKQADINTVTLGVFAWAKLEPQEGVYDLDWMADTIDRLYENGISVNLSTPSGARPRWLADKYPEVLRVNEKRERMLFGFRHNHCPSSGAYREKVRLMNMQLAARFDSHPGVQMWHISNELGGDCHCPLCQEAFRKWLKNRYGTIDALNRAWNTTFWSRTLTDFSQAESPSPIGEFMLQGLLLDWRRFETDLCADYIRAEVSALREAGAKKPVTTNFMYNFNDYNYHVLAKELDIVSWDNYPQWHKRSDAYTAADSAMQHDIMRTLKKQPFLLMESAPGATNWTGVSKLPRPGVIEANGLQALAHGSDSILYFQIRKSRGASEKFHAALIGHFGSDKDRTYLECRKTGEDLQNLAGICGAPVPAQAAVICDWENRWALHGSQGPRNENLYDKDCMFKAYRSLRRLGLNVDLPDMEQDLDDYKVVIAPMLYLFRADFEKKIRRFVERGGIFVMTYWSGVVDENDLACLGGTPHDLMDVMGLRSTEIDALYEGESNTLCRPDTGTENGSTAKASPCGWMSRDSYTCEHLCQLVSADTAETLLVYGSDFYAGTPALTVNSYGSGLAYYLCADAEPALWNDLARRIAAEAGLSGPLAVDLPEGIEVTTRRSDNAEYIFIQNFTGCAWRLPKTALHNHCEVLLGKKDLELDRYDTLILKTV